MNITAPTSETSISKINNSFYTISWGPGAWTENRTDDVIKSINVVIKGWLKDNAPMIDKTTSSDEVISYVRWEQAGTVQESFTWLVPEALQTTATWHGHQHPHDADNDDIYLPLMKQWLALIKDTDEYISKYNSVVSQLGAL